MNIKQFLLSFAAVFAVSFFLHGCVDYGGISNTGSGAICITPSESGDDVEGQAIDCSQSTDNSDNSVEEAAPVEE